MDAVDTTLPAVQYRVRMNNLEEESAVGDMYDVMLFDEIDTGSGTVEGEESCAYFFGSGISDPEYWFGEFSANRNNNGGLRGDMPF